MEGTMGASFQKREFHIEGLRKTIVSFWGALREEKSMNTPLVPPVPDSDEESSLTKRFTNGFEVVDHESEKSRISAVLKELTQNIELLRIEKARSQFIAEEIQTILALRL